MVKCSKHYASTPICCFVLHKGSPWLWEQMPHIPVSGNDLATCAHLLRTVAPPKGAFTTPLVLRCSSEGTTIMALRTSHALEDAVLSMPSSAPASSLVRHVFIPLVAGLPDGRALAVSVASTIADALCSGACPNSVVVGDENTRRANRSLWRTSLERIRSVAVRDWPTLLSGRCPIAHATKAVIESAVHGRFSPIVCKPLGEAISMLLDVVSDQLVPLGDLIRRPPILRGAGMDVTHSKVVSGSSVVMELRRPVNVQHVPHRALLLAEDEAPDSGSDDDSTALPYCMVMLLRKLGGHCTALDVSVVYTDMNIEEHLTAAYDFRIVRVVSLEEVKRTVRVVTHSSVHQCGITEEDVVCFDCPIALSNLTILLHLQNGARNPIVVPQLIIGSPSSDGGKVWAERRECVISVLHLVHRSTHAVPRNAALVELVEHLSLDSSLQNREAQYLISSLLCNLRGRGIPDLTMEADAVVIGAVSAALEGISTLVGVDSLLV